MPYTLRGKIANVTPLTLDKTLSLEGSSADAKAVGDAIAEAKRIAKEQDEAHANLKDNPHNVTVEQLGLDNVDNTSDMDKPVSTAQAEAIADAKKAGTDAQEAAENAQTSADNAQTAADNAQTAADNAQTTANEAKALAEEAKTYAGGLHKTFSATIPASGWSESAPYTQEVSVPGIKEEDYPHVFPVYSEMEEEALSQMDAWTLVSRGVPSADKITFFCIKGKPDVDISIQIEVNR